MEVAGPLGTPLGLAQRKSCDPQKSPDTPGSPEGNTEGPGTASSEPTRYERELREPLVWRQGC